MIKCTENICVKKEFVTDSSKGIIENKGRDIDANETFGMIEDALQYLENKEEEEHGTN